MMSGWHEMMAEEPVEFGKKIDHKSKQMKLGKYNKEEVKNE